MPNLPKPRRRRYLPDRKRTPTGDQSFYNTARWRKTSQAVRKATPLCEVCDSTGQVVAAEVVDHIIAREQGGADYDQRNLMAMCRYHHDRKSGLEGGGLELSAKRTVEGLVPVDRSEVIITLTRPGKARPPTGGWGPP